MADGPLILRDYMGQPTIQRSLMLDRIILVLQLTFKERFWGEITIKFRDGKPTLIQKLSQEKLD